MRYFFRPLKTHEEWDWLYERAKPALCEDMKGIVAYRGSELVAAICLDNWSYNSATIHVTIEDPYVLRNGFIEEVLTYVFVTADKGILIGITPADNDKALRFNKHVGFTELYRIKDGYMLGIDYVVQELRRENSKYLRNADGQERHSRAA